MLTAFAAAVFLGGVLGGVVGYIIGFTKGVTVGYRSEPLGEAD